MTMLEFIVPFTDKAAAEKFDRYHGTNGELVRCKDCKYAHMTYDGEVKYCDRISMPDDEGDYGYALYLPGDWFCADGERRGEGAADTR